MELGYLSYFHRFHKLEPCLSNAGELASLATYYHLCSFNFRNGADFLSVYEERTQNNG